MVCLHDRGSDYVAMILLVECSLCCICEMGSYQNANEVRYDYFCSVDLNF